MSKKRLSVLLGVILIICAIISTHSYLIYVEEAKENVKYSSHFPTYSGMPYVEINGNIPYFSEEDYSKEFIEYYSELDA